MRAAEELPLPVLDALPLGAHRLMAYTDERLFQACGVRIAFTGREGGTSVGQFASLNLNPFVGDDERAVDRNIRLVCEALGASCDRIIASNQVHGTAFVSIMDNSKIEAVREQASQGADGLLVEQRNVMGLQCAGDCPLVIVVSPSGRFAMAHAGWRGAVAGIAGKAVRLLREIDTFEPVRYNAYIGPHIRSECFEVSEEVTQKFKEALGRDCLRDSRHVSLARAISIDLERNGIELQRVADMKMCTKCNPELYFSYRATNGACGRHGAVAIRM